MNRYPPFSWNFEQRSIKFLLLFSVTGSWLLLSLSPLLRRKVWVLPTRPEAITRPTVHTTAGLLPPLQWAAGTGTARAAMGLWVQEKSKRSSSQSTVSTIWDFNEGQGWSRCGWIRVLVCFRSSAKSRDSNKYHGKKEQGQWSFLTKKKHPQVN